VCKDVLIKYKHENSSAHLDFTGTGVNQNTRPPFGKPGLPQRADEVIE